MKKVLPILIAGSLAALLIADLAMGKDDASVIETALAALEAADLNPVDNGGGGSAVPELKPADVLAIVTDLREVEANGGHLGIARRNKVSTQQVKAVAKGIKARLRELAPEPVIE